MKKSKPIVVSIDHAALLRRSLHDDYVFAMREGRRQRPTTFRSKKAYTRTRKHK